MATGAKRVSPEQEALLRNALASALQP